MRLLQAQSKLFALRRDVLRIARSALWILQGLLRFLQECEEEMGGISRRLGRRLSDMGLKAFKPSESPEFKTFARESASTIRPIEHQYVVVCKRTTSVVPGTFSCYTVS